MMMLSQSQVMTFAMGIILTMNSMSNGFIVPSSRFVSPAAVPSKTAFFMSSAEEEAARLREQAQKLREEAATLSGSDESVTEEKVSVESSTAVTGTFYDDEVEPTRKDPLSESMRDRLRREASTGLDSNQSQTNVILYISIAVAILVLVGGKGILY